CAGPHRLPGALGGKSPGVLGLGRIGEAIAKRAQACGMKIRYQNRNRKDVPYPYAPDPATLAKNSDVLIVVTPATAETARIINARVLDALGPDGYLVNIARGSVVDERSEEHTSELQSLTNLVCRLLLAKQPHSTLNPR